MNKLAQFTLYILLCTSGSLWAQPANDGCYTPITIPGATNWCSGVAEFTNAGATPSGYGAPSCWLGGASNDVWFSFVSTGTDVTITVIGNQSPAPGGTLNSPQIALYLGTCGGNINQMGCASAQFGANAVDMYEGGLIIGQTYLVRIQGQSGNTGTFQLCLNNYNAPASPGSDCATAAILCDKSPFVVQSVTGAGSDPDEAANSCLGGLGSNSESNSTWFKWTCATSGTLTFTLTPNVPSDDLDFVVYELQGSVTSCTKTELRCMAAGDFAFPSPCMGPTGLSLSSTDLTETAGCQEPNKDNFVKYIDMVAGRSYALLVNNFSSSGNGFGISFGGTGTFQGPTANFTRSPATICAGQTVTIADASTFPNGSITARTWGFGIGANPASANTVGPHTVQYNTPGQKAITLTVETDLGCVVTSVQYVQVDSCCQTVNAVTYTTTENNVLCNGDQNGSVAITPTGAGNYTFLWSNFTTGSSLSNLGVGNYAVTISNGICTETDVLEVDGPPNWILNLDITRPTCDGGTDGAIQLTQVSGSNGAPYQYNWENTGFGNNTSLLNLSNGIYNLVIRDGLGCDTTMDIEVHELILDVDYQLSTIRNPSCYGYTDGYIEIEVLNGTAPYNFHWTNGATTNILANLPIGTYILDTIWDANRCRSWEADTFVLVQPDTLTVYLDSFQVSCFGDSDGILIPYTQGGTYPYYYQWSNGVQDSFYTQYAPGHYNLMVTDAQGCTATAAATVNEPPQMFIDSVHSAPATCYGYGDGEITIFASGGRPWESGTYRYSLDPNKIFTPNNHFIRPAGTYTVYAEDSMGCRVSGDVLVQQPNEFFVDAGDDITILLGETFDAYAELSYVDFYDYQWTSVTPDNAEIDCDSCRGTQILPYDNGCYAIQITNEAGCIAVDTLCVTLNKRRDIFIPNAFTPNGDGVNDILLVYSARGVAEVKDYMVFDRWGELVFHGKHIQPNWSSGGWNGMYQGKEMPSGVYVYVIQVQFLDGVIETYKGDLTLVR